MKICFLARPTFDWYSVKFLKTFRNLYDNNTEGIFITTNLKETNYVKENINNVEVHETSTYLKEHWNEFTVEKLIYFEEKYQCKPIWKYIYTDRFLIYKDYDYVVHITVGLFSFFEKIFQNSQVDFYYSEVISTLQCYIAYIVGKKYNVKYISQMCARGSLGSLFHYHIVEEYQYNYLFPDNYKNIVFSSQEIDYAKNYLEEFEKRKDTGLEELNGKSKPKLRLKMIRGVISRLVNSFNPLCNDKYSYMNFGSYKNRTNELKFYFNYQISKKYYKKADYSKKYVYFPLHYQPEASTCVCAEKYENQLFYIDSWAKSLPADTLLYVKEHYVLLGNRNLQFYKELKKYPNVVLIDPWESTKKLIENSVAVTTLTGSAGFEAMLLRKPVFLGGNSVYENAPGVIKVKDIYQNYLPNIETWKKPTKNEIIQYLCACIRSYDKGNVYAQFKYELIDENIELLCRSVYKQMKRLKAEDI